MSGFTGAAAASNFVGGLGVLITGPQRDRASGTAGTVTTGESTTPLSADGMGQFGPFAGTIAAAGPERPIGTIAAGADSARTSLACTFFALVGFWGSTVCWCELSRRLDWQLP